MNPIDLVILLVLAGGAARGLQTGFVRQAASLVGAILAFGFAVQLMDPAGAMLVQSLDLSPRVAPVVGFLVVFIGVLAGVGLLARMVEGLVGLLRLSFVNRLGGAVFGAVKAALIAGVVLLALDAFALPGLEARAASELYDPVASFLPQAWAFASEHWPALRDLPEQFLDVLPEEAIAFFGSLGQKLR